MKYMQALPNDINRLYRIERDHFPVVSSNFKHLFVRGWIYSERSDKLGAADPITLFFPGFAQVSN